MSQTTPSVSTFTYNPNNHYLFSRTYAIAIGAPKQTSALQYSNLSITVAGQKIPAAPLRVSFDIDKTLSGTSNKSKFEIYNMSSQNRSKIKAGYIVQMQAGYAGLMNTIFVGNVDMKGARSERKGSDIVTIMECGEGESTIVMARLDQSYPSGTTLVQVLQDIADALNVNDITTDQGTGFGSIVGIPNFTYGRGISVHGSCKDSLDKLLKPFGLRWSVQNGNLNIIPATAHNGNTAIVVASGSITDPNSGVTSFNPNNCTGLISTPSNTGYYTEFTALLNPNIVPGCLIQLICENTTINGYYRVNRAHYVGDTHDNKWQVMCECVPMPGNVQTIPIAKGSNLSTAVTA
jgi:hypothetical protein